MSSAGKTPKRPVKLRPQVPRVAGPRDTVVSGERATVLTVDPEYAGQRLDNFLLRLARGVPKSHVYRIVRSGEVRVNRGRASAELRVQAGDAVRIPPLRTSTKTTIGLAPAEMPPILFEDDHLIAVDKPAGVAAHGGSGIAFGLIERVRAARAHQPFLELAHRLDRQTSGVLLLAKSRRALTRLHAAMRDGEIDKRYRVLVVGRWHNERQHVKAPLHKFVTAGGERRVSVDPEGQVAHTVFNRIEQLRAQGLDFALLEAELHTGRTHQIRVHLAHLDFPIIGDDKYGDFELNKRVARPPFAPPLKRMFLHARSVALAHPVTGEPLRIEAPLARDCSDFLDGLRKGELA